MNYCDPLFNLNDIELKKTAFFELDTGRQATFEDIKTLVKKVASFFVTNKVQPGDIVAIHLYNSIDVIVVHMAAQYIGAVSCLIDPLVQPKSLDYYINETEAKVFVTHCSKGQLSDGIVKKTDILHETALPEVYKSAIYPELNSLPFEWNKEDTSYLYYTSGTTSEPKGVALTQRSHENFFKITDLYWQPVDENSRHICYVPFSHGFGSIFLIPLTIRTRGQLYIMRSFHPGKVADAIDKFDISHIYGVPSHYQQLLRYEGYHKALKKLRLAFCAASKLEYEIMQKWEEVTGILLNEGYGLIETDCGIVWRVGYKPLGTGHVGVCPDPSLVEIGILDENNEPLSAGNEGEICIKGPSIMKGYYKKPQENSRVFVNGWFKTGDKGYISPDNQLFMTGRIKDIINIAGIKISPFEVEAVLNTHPSVTLSVVVAVEDKLYGEIVKAYVLREPGKEVTERELIKYSAEHLINFQVPKIIEFVDSFPMTNMGKVDRKKLRTI